MRLDLSLGLAAKPKISAFHPASIFGPSDNGALIAPWDLTSMRVGRDGSGGTPAADDVAGILLDTSQMGGKTADAFIASQSELVTNGGFDTDTDWTKGSGWVISGGVASKTPGIASDLIQAGIFSPGSYYSISLTISNYGAGNVTVFPGFPSSNTAVLFANGDYSFILKGSGDGALYLSANASADLDIDSVSVKEIPGNHFIAPSDAARAIVRVSGGLTYLEPDGVDDWYPSDPLASLGETWSHVGGWRSDATGDYAFALSNNANQGGALKNETNDWAWRNSGDTAHDKITETNPSATHVLTIEDATNIAARFNAASEISAFAPLDDSADAQGLALFSGSNGAASSVFDGRFYGGVWIDRAITAVERTDNESFFAGKSGVTL